MKKLRFRNYIFYFILVIVTAGITLLVIFLISGEETRSKILMEYEAERAAALVLEEYFERRLDNPMGIDERLRGFAIYEPEGKLVYAWGRVPREFDAKAEGKSRRHFRYSEDGNTLTLTRPIGVPRMSRMMFRRLQRGEPPPPPSIVYMVFDASGHLARARSVSLAMRLIPFVMSASMLVIAFLYAKNSRYRLKLASQSELEKLGEIARTLAHEIKNPLGAMQIHTGYLKKLLPKETHSELSLLEEEISRLNLLTQRISDFVRDPVGIPEEIDLAQFIADIARRFKSKVLFTQNEPGSLVVSFDRERLYSVLVNLVTNGIESYGETETGGEHLVEIALAQEKGKVLLTIRDRGMGIPPGAEEKIFDPFFSTKTKGSGIGLAITKRFIEARCGEIRLSQRQGGGTETRILFKSCSGRHAKNKI